MHSHSVLFELSQFKWPPSLFRSWNSGQQGIWLSALQKRASTLYWPSNVLLGLTSMLLCMGEGGGCHSLRKWHWRTPAMGSSGTFVSKALLANKKSVNEKRGLAMVDLRDMCLCRFFSSRGHNSNRGLTVVFLRDSITFFCRSWTYAKHWMTFWTPWWRKECKLPCDTKKGMHLLISLVDKPLTILLDRFPSVL